MQKIKIAATVLFTLTVAFSCTNDSENKVSKSSAVYHEDKNEEASEIQGALEWRRLILADQRTGEIPLDKIYEARNAANMMSANKSTALGLEWEDMGPDNIGGRTRSLLIDMNDRNHLITGGVAGGLWQSFNGGNSWQIHPVTETMEGFSISSIVQDVEGNIYVGTGEIFVGLGFSIQYTPAFAGEGIYKSTDGGATFARLPATIPGNTNNPGDEWSFVNRIAVDPTNVSRVYAATNKGLMVSDDAGDSWYLAPGTVATTSRDVKVNLDGVVFAEINNDLYRSEDGVTFVNCSTDPSFNFPNGGVGRIELAVSPTDADYIYALCVNNGGCLFGVYRSTNTGESWSNIGPGGAGGFEPFGGNCQGWYDAAICVSSADPNLIYIGGITVWRWSPTLGWGTITDYGGFPNNPIGVHPDIHGIISDPTDADILYIVTDGGVYKSLNALDEVPTFGEENKGYNVTQFYWFGVAHTGEILGGTQDNGTLRVDYYSQNTIHGAAHVMGGDGMACDISHVHPEVYFASIYYGDIYRSFNKGDGFSPFFDFHIDSDGDGEIDDGADWVTPMFLAENVDSGISRFLVGAQNRLWIVPDIMSGSPTWFNIANVSGSITCIESTEDAGTVYVGTTGGKIYRVTGLNNAVFEYDSNDVFNVTAAGIVVNNIETFPGRYVSGIAVDKNDPERVVVALTNYNNQNYVYAATDAFTNNNPTFVSLQNNLPLMPVHDAVIDRNDPNRIFLATELGVWASEDWGATWSEENAGIGRVPTIQIRQDRLYDEDCQVLYVCTHGRGFFRSTTLTDGSCNTSVGISDEIAAEKGEMKIYPNPVSSSATIELPLDELVNASVKIYSLTGKIVQERNSISSADGNLKIDASKLLNGNYIISIETGDYRFHSKLVVMH